MEKEQYIQQYISGKLTDADKKVFEKLLETDIAFQKELKLQQDLVAAFKLQEAREIKATLQDLEFKNINQVNKKTSFSKVWYLAIASILLVGFFLTNNTTPSGEDLYNSNYSVYPNTYLPITRGNIENTSLKAFVSYEKGDFESAELAFEKLLQMEANPDIQFYYALSLLNQFKYDLALSELSPLTQMEYDYQAESLWYSALIHLKNEDFKNAKNQLEKLKNLDTKFKSEETKQLLKELNND
jgi:tetratricopeptide (TPR) repeat protein